MIIMDKQLINQKRRQIFNKYFYSQTLLDDRNKDVPALSVPHNITDSIRLEAGGSKHT